MKLKSPRVAKLPGIVAALLLTWVLASNSFATTAAEIITQARVFLNDSSADTGRQRFSDAQLLNFLNSGQRELNSLNYLFQTTHPIVISTGTYEYALPSKFLTTQRVWYTDSSTRTVKLNQTSFEQLDANSPGWYATTGRPNSYIIDRNDSGVAIWFYPKPVGAAGVGNVTVWYIEKATDCTDITCVPFNGQVIFDQFAFSLSYYIAYRGYMSMLDSATATAYFNEWSIYLTKIKDAALKQPDYNPGMTGTRTP